MLGAMLGGRLGGPLGGRLGCLLGGLLGGPTGGLVGGSLALCEPSAGGNLHPTGACAVRGGHDAKAPSGARRLSTAAGALLPSQHVGCCS